MLNTPFELRGALCCDGQTVNRRTVSLSDKPVDCDRRRFCRQTAFWTTDSANQILIRASWATCRLRETAKRRRSSSFSGIYTLLVVRDVRVDKIGRAHV